MISTANHLFHFYLKKPYENIETDLIQPLETVLQDYEYEDWIVHNYQNTTGFEYLFTNVRDEEKISFKIDQFEINYFGYKK